MKKTFVAAIMLLVLTFSLFANDAPFDKIKVSESLILSEKEIQLVVDECTSRYSGLELLNNIVDRLNALYLEKGYPNARAYIPEQNIENRTVLIELVEGRVGTITVSGQKYTTERYILRSLKIDSNKVLDLTDLEKKLVTFNRWNSGIKLTTTLNPGKDKPGTTDIDIKVNETVPFSGHFSFDNYASEASGYIRAGLHLALKGLTTVAYFGYGSNSIYADYNFPAFGDSPKIDARFGIRGSYSNSEVPNGVFTIKSESFSGSVYMGTILESTPTKNISLLLSSTYSTTTTGIDDIQFPTETILSGRIGISALYVTDRINISASAGASVGTLLEGRTNVPMYGKFDASLNARIATDDISFATINATSQWMPFNRVIPNQEMLYAGGASTVRGYKEGIFWGKSGYIVSSEFHMWLPGSTRSSVFLFADHAGIFPYPNVRDNYLLSAGMGLNLNFENYAHFKFNLGAPAIVIDQNEIVCNFSLSISL